MNSCPFYWVTMKWETDYFLLVRSFTAPHTIISEFPSDFSESHSWICSILRCGWEHWRMGWSFRSTSLSPLSLVIKLIHEHILDPRALKDVSNSYPCAASGNWIVENRCRWEISSWSETNLDIVRPPSLLNCSTSSSFATRRYHRKMYGLGEVGDARF